MQVFYISKCSLRTANKKFTTIKNDYELFLNNDSLIEPVSTDIIATIDSLFSMLLEKYVMKIILPDWISG